VLEGRCRHRLRGDRRQSAELGGVELAEPAEVADAKVLADADQRDPLRRDVELFELGQDLDELQLVVEVGLEPQHVLAKAMRLERSIALGELGQGADVLRPPAGEEP
jgi:hypothetical protein